MADTPRASSGASQEDVAKAAHERRREQIRRAQRYVDVQCGDHVADFLAPIESEKTIT